MKRLLVLLLLSGCLGPDVPPPDDLVPFSTRSAATSFDSRRGVLLRFGGLGEGNRPHGTTWAWSEQTRWQLVSDDGPWPRSQAAMAYDPVRDRTVLFGGIVRNFSAAACAQTWEWDGESWSMIDVENGPTCRRGHQMIYDPVGQRILMFGGYTPGGCRVGSCQELWAYDGEWTFLNKPPGS